jgi:Na+/H+ antiporter NhaD/arsenite permease-like protein
MDKKIKIKIDPVLCAAWLLAAVSAFFVHPGKDYISYIDWRSLGILWSLMVIIQGLKENSVFERIAEKLLSKVKGFKQLVLVLVFLCFFSAMLITNDVALITFVPFSIMILINCSKKKAIIPVVVLQTVAANLGSMLTPIGNPQNLYLYGLTSMSFVQFVSCMLPYTLMSAILLVISVMIMPKGDAQIADKGDFHIVKHFGSKRQVIVYAALFLIAILSVLRVIPWHVMSIIVFVIILGMDLKILFRADYILLLTFIGFFIFTGNMGRIPQIHDFFMSTVSGREFAISVLLSQVISNVPATLMLSGFCKNYRELLTGVNVGGLGTLIASMASLISYKAYASMQEKNVPRYIIVFTVVNLLFLAVLCLMHMLIFAPIQ